MAGGCILGVVAHGRSTEIEMLGFTVNHSSLSSFIQIFTNLECFECLVSL